jgi:hypothetical protein
MEDDDGEASGNGFTKRRVEFGAGDMKILSESFVFIYTCDINNSSYCRISLCTC